MPAYGNLAGVELGDGLPVRLLGVINVSPESFYAGSVPETEDELRRRAAAMAEEGADLLDVGARSTAPYRETDISEDEEAQRLGAAIRVIRGTVSLPISADTSRVRVALTALDEGAQVINDVTGFRMDPALADIVAKRAEGVILMASPAGRTRPDPLGTVRSLLEASLQATWKAGIPAHRVVVDPGIGFFRDSEMSWADWDCEVLRRLEELRDLERPIAIGVSRKSFLGKLLGKDDPVDRLVGSLAATVAAVLHGAHCVRTHDVRATREAVKVAEALRPS